MSESRHLPLETVRFDPLRPSKRVISCIFHNWKLLSGHAGSAFVSSEKVQLRHHGRSDHIALHKIVEKLGEGGMGVVRAVGELHNHDFGVAISPG